jgi:uncharacterized protein (DUF488 family)
MRMEPVCTIGHSNRTIDDFIGLLRQNGIACLLDIRTVPKSRHNPQFGQDQLAVSLAAAGIGYRYMKGLGGLRRPHKDSPNAGWRNASFRGYADYLDSAGFAQGLHALLELAARRRTALMCAEAVWWRCHRAIIADVLCVRGIRVVHIVDATRSIVHPFTSPARVVHGKLAYPAPTADDGARLDA